MLWMKGKPNSWLNFARIKLLKLIGIQKEFAESKIELLGTVDPESLCKYKERSSSPHNSLLQT